jgi:hypothetical protein
MHLAAGVESSSQLSSPASTASIALPLYQTQYKSCPPPFFSSSLAGHESNQDQFSSLLRLFGPHAYDRLKMILYHHACCSGRSHEKRLRLCGPTARTSSALFLSHLSSASTSHSSSIGTSLNILSPVFVKVQNLRLLCVYK